MPSPMPLVEPVMSETLSLSVFAGAEARSVMAIFMAAHSCWVAGVIACKEHALVERDHARDTVFREMPFG